MNRTAAFLGSLVFLVVAPGTIGVLVPYRLSRWQVRPAFLGVGAFRVTGVILIALGAAGLVECFVRFAMRGRGTPAPVAPPAHLVVSGLYRHVRNPMYVAILSAVVGQALLLGAPELLGYAAVLWLAFHLFVVGYEEPTLRATFGAEYDEFRASVPRWIPRVRGWRGP
jgi:protein-S-isoprenylcysteine O-methyltransferase Ste14